MKKNKKQGGPFLDMCGLFMLAFGGETEVNANVTCLPGPKRAWDSSGKGSCPDWKKLIRINK